MEITNEDEFCWHHGDLVRLRGHLEHGRIDLYGPHALTPKRKQNRLARFVGRHHLKAGDKIRIKVKDKIYYKAVIKNGKPYTLPVAASHGIWQSAMDLERITLVAPPLLANCKIQGSHRLRHYRALLKND